MNGKFKTLATAVRRISARQANGGSSASTPTAAFEAITAGKNVGIMAPTASEKTMGYNLPVLQHPPAIVRNTRRPTNDETPVKCQFGGGLLSR